MLLGSDTHTDSRNTESFGDEYIKDVEFCGQLINRYMFEEAWTLISSFRQESIPLLYCKALCLFETSNYPACLDTLDKILIKLSTRQNRIPQPQDEELKALHEVQRQQVTYLNPVTFRYVELFPENLKESALRMTVDCWSELGNVSKVLKIATPLKSKGYRNILEALDKITNPGLYE